jgi:hypothetical protein
MIIVHALNSLCPGARYSVENNDYDTLKWEDTRYEMPSREAVEAEMQRSKDYFDSIKYQQLRSFEYPPMADYLDAVYWQSKGDDSKMTAYLAAVEAVKSKYPKENA